MENYCQNDPATGCAGTCSNPVKIENRKIDDTVTLRCNNGYENTYKEYALIATCSENTESNGKWVLNDQCQGKQ